MDFRGDVSGCMPQQIASITMAIDDLLNIGVLGCEDCEYDRDSLEYSYSYDGVTWSCFGNFTDISRILVNSTSDFYLKIKVNGPIAGIIEMNESGEGYHKLDYTTQLSESFKFDPAAAANSVNIYNPYSNMEGALTLQETLNETVSSMFGIACYYFKLAPNKGSRDITFKEYALMDVEDVKQIKLVIGDGKMPSSKPEFADFGLEWGTDWEVEITKGTFATAFGNTSQPMEGDLIYIPMMKRMWMVSAAYEEKNGSLMWNATTFTVVLVKYQEKGSVDLGTTQEMVDSFVKNKYDDLFGDQENLDSGEHTVSTPLSSSENLYPIYKSDAMRKWITVQGIDILAYSLYYKGTLVADNHYKFNNPQIPAKVIYQRKYCGKNGSVSFIIYPTTIDSYNDILLEISDIKIKISQNNGRVTLSLTNDEELMLNISTGAYYFVWLRWSEAMNMVDFGAAQYKYPEGIPLYKLQNQHFYFDMDNLVEYKQVPYNLEFVVEEEKDIILHQFYGTISNIKVFDVYNDRLTELLQQYPTNGHLIVNDAVRKVLDLHGPGLK